MSAKVTQTILSDKAKLSSVVSASGGCGTKKTSSANTGCNKIYLAVLK